jgi:hypothetical protein
VASVTSELVTEAASSKRPSVQVGTRAGGYLK